MRESRNPGRHFLRIATMKVLVVGGGVREHAIVEALHRSQAEIYAAMANQNPAIRRRSKKILLGEDRRDGVSMAAEKVLHRAEVVVRREERVLDRALRDASRCGQPRGRDSGTRPCEERIRVAVVAA